MWVCYLVKIRLRNDGRCGRGDSMKLSGQRLERLGCGEVFGGQESAGQGSRRCGLEGCVFEGPEEAGGGGLHTHREGLWVREAEKVTQ